MRKRDSLFLRVTTAYFRIVAYHILSKIHQNVFISTRGAYAITIILMEITSPMQKAEINNDRLDAINLGLF